MPLENPALRNRFWAILRDREGVELYGVTSTWAAARRRVGDPASAASLWHGFPSQGEAFAYVEAARPRVARQWLD